MKLRSTTQRNTPQGERAWCRWSVVAFLALLAGTVWAAVTQVPSATVLVVNSDAAIEKYSVAEESFRETFDGPVKEINLAGLSDRAAERAIRSEAPSAIYSIGTRASVVANRASEGRPVVMSSVINWQRLPAASADATHVIANELPSAAQLTMFRYFFPKVRRIGVLYSAEFNQQWLDEAVAAGRDVGIEVVGVRVRSTRGARSELSRLLPRVDALWVTSDPVVLADEKAVRALFDDISEARKPVFTYASAFAELNPTLIVAPDVPTIGRQAAGILQNLAPGAKKEVQSPAGSEVTLNLRAVKEYGLELNAEALDSVNRVIR